MAKPTFRATPSQVQVPATSANLGPGFDCLGLALQMHDKYVARVIDEPGLDIDVIGEGAENLPRNEKNLLVKAMFAGFDYLGGRPRGLAIRAKNVIPHGRGLGSSASAIVGGRGPNKSRSGASYYSKIKPPLDNFVLIYS